MCFCLLYLDEKEVEDEEETMVNEIDCSEFIFITRCEFF